MHRKFIEMTEAAPISDEIVLIEVTELELREDLLSSVSLFSCCCPCFSGGGYPNPTPTPS